jgi:hypothetical protein
MINLRVSVPSEETPRMKIWHQRRNYRFPTLGLSNVSSRTVSKAGNQNSFNLLSRGIYLLVKEVVGTTQMCGAG